MTRENDELRKLLEIERALQQEDPEFSNKLKAIGHRRSRWLSFAHTTLALAMFLFVLGAVIQDRFVPAVGGIALLTIYPLFLYLGKEQTHDK